MNKATIKLINGDIITVPVNDVDINEADQIVSITNKKGRSLIPFSSILTLTIEG